VKRIIELLAVFTVTVFSCTAAENHRASKNDASQPAHSTLLYVGNSRGEDVTVIDLNALKILDQFKLGDRVHGLAIDGSGRFLFATVESDHTLRVVDTSSDHVIATIPVTGRPNQCAVTLDGKYVVVPIRDRDSVDIIDVQQRKVIKVLPLKVPHNAVIFPGSNRLVFVSSMGDRAINLIDLSTLDYSAKLSVGGVPRPYVLADDGRTIYVAESDLHGFVEVSVPEKRVVRRVEIPSMNKTPHPRPYEPIETLTHGLALSPDGRELWVTSLLDDSIYVYDVVAKRVTERLTTGDGPNWVSFSPDGKFVCVSNTDSQDVSIFDAKSHKELARIKTGGVPKRVLVADVPVAPALEKSAVSKRK